MASSRERTCFSSGFQQTLVLISQLSGAPVYWRQWSRRMSYLAKVSKAWSLEARSLPGTAFFPGENFSPKYRAWRYYETGKGKIN